MTRISWVDNFRGFAMILMCFDHFAMTTPSLRWLLDHTWETFGFVSMAEVFVFISGFCVGHWNTPTAKLHRRARHLYFVHLAMIVFIVALAWIKPSIIGDRTGASQYHPALNLLTGAVFLFQPFAADIFPLYIGLLLLAPIVLRRLHSVEKYRFYHVLLPSFCLWLLAQLIPTNIRELGPVLLPYFNPIGWQLHFVLGIVAGYVASRPDLMGKIESGVGFHRRKLFLILVALALGCFVLHGQYFNNVSHFIFRWAERGNLGPLRLINFYVLVGLCWVASPWVPKFRSPKWLSLVSENSLLVYSTHTYMVYLWLFVQPAETLRWSIWTQVAVISGMFLILLSVVRLILFVDERRTP